MSDQPKIRLHAILAKNAPTAVVFRRGPSKVFVTLGWNLKTDSFFVGQWLKGVIDITASSLSPDGKYLLYEAATYRSGDWRTECYSAISYAPYLRALDFYFHNTIESFGGFFIDNQTAYFPASEEGLRYPENRHLTKLNLLTSTDKWKRTTLGNRFGGYFTHGLLDSGWSEHINADRSISWRKPLPHGLILEKYPIQRGAIASEQANRIIDSNETSVLGGDSWEWADYDSPRKRVVFATAGKMFAVPVKAPEIAPRELFDFNDMKYERKAAPYTEPYPCDRNNRR